MIFVSGPKFSEKDELVSMFYDKSSSGAGIPVVNIKRSAVDKFLNGTGKTVEELESKLNDRNYLLHFRYLKKSF